jgi:hypothetical protein
MTLASFRQVERELVRAGRARVIRRALDLRVPRDADAFAVHIAWIIVCGSIDGGSTRARADCESVRRALIAGLPAKTVLAHRRKAVAIDQLWEKRTGNYRLFLAAPDRHRFLRGLPGLGPKGSLEAARDFGVDVIVSDANLDRLASRFGMTHAELARSIADQTPYMAGGVSLVLRAAITSGLLDLGTGFLGTKHTETRQQGISYHELPMVQTRYRARFLGEIQF